MTLKSNSEVPCFCVMVIITYANIANIVMKDVSATNAKNYKEMEILDDLPLRSSLDDYVTKLEKIMNFVHSHRRYMDMNMGFGIFLVNVNLRTILQIRGVRIPKNKKSRLCKVLQKYDDIMKYFQDELSKHKSGCKESESSAHLITDLYSKGEEFWAIHLQKFKTNLLKKTNFFSKKVLTEKYSKWSQYVEEVYDFDQFYPSPQVSDDCISSLSQVPVNPTVRWKRCGVSHSCTDMVRNGTDYGYAITHRLLFLLTARFSRGCTIMSSVHDKEHIERFCLKIYNEMEYHSYHNFEMPDLALEMIGMCTLEGHVQFLRRSWLEELLEFQKELGCVASSIEGKEKKVRTDLYDVEKPNWKIGDDNNDILGGACNSHTTGVAATALSAAIRYIIEKFY